MGTWKPPGPFGTFRGRSVKEDREAGSECPRLEALQAFHGRRGHGDECGMAPEGAM